MNHKSYFPQWNDFNRMMNEWMEEWMDKKLMNISLFSHLTENIYILQLVLLVKSQNSSWCNCKSSVTHPLYESKMNIADVNMYMYVHKCMYNIVNVCMQCVFICVYMSVFMYMWYKYVHEHVQCKYKYVLCMYTMFVILQQQKVNKVNWKSV